MSQTYFEENFQPWMEEVDIIIYNQTGFHFDELPDQFYADNFEAGTSVNDMANITISDYESYFTNFISNIDKNNAIQP
tara:strand:- start:2911 stop:3144 length:234 start_codon:yes stop_codon:yes gene_type:complete